MRDAAVPSDRQRKRPRRRGRGTTRREAGGATTRDESGRWTAQGERVESDEGTTRDMELYVFVICAEKAEKNVVTWSFYAFVIFVTKLVSHGQPVRGVHHPSQICDENHKFVTGLA